MKRKVSISHDETIIRRLRKDPDFAAEYLKAALEDEDEPRTLLIALAAENFGDCKSLCQGLFEPRIDWGPRGATSLRSCDF
jgi:hypothetical protein